MRRSLPIPPENGIAKKEKLTAKEPSAAKPQPKNFYKIMVDKIISNSRAEKGFS
jgi:hypothetical protein